jgi:tight adherence protein B
MPTSLLAVVFLGTFTLAALAVLFSRRVLVRNRPETQQRLQDDSDWLASLQSPNLLKEEQLSTISFWDRILARFDGIELLKKRIAEAGLRWSVGRVTAMMMLSGASTGVILNGLDWVPRYITVAAVGLALATPYLMVLRRRSKRMAAFELQFPDALDTVARAIRAGNTLGAALDILAREAKPPVSTEIRKTVDERSLGLTWEQALQNLAGRVPTLEVNMFVAAIQLQTRTGGRLHEVLAKLSESMREAASLKGEVRAISAHGRLTGSLLTILPIIIAGTMAYVNPGHLASLWNHPAGKDLITASVACLVAAHLVIRKLTDVKI